MAYSNLRVARRLFNFRMPQVRSHISFPWGSQALQLRTSLANNMFWQHKRTFFTTIDTLEAFAEAKVTARIEPSMSTEVPKEHVLAVMQFSASWCGPCRTITPAFKALSEKHPDVQFFYVDADILEDPSPPFTLRTLPTFLFFLDGKLVERLEGSQDKLLHAKFEAALERFKNLSPEA